MTPLPLYIVVPLKGGERAKSRLATVLPPDARKKLWQAMARRVIAAARGAAPHSLVLVVTACPEAAELAQGAGALPILDTRNDGTAAACRQVAEQVGHSAALLFLNADLPLLTADAVGRMATREGVVIAPDRRRTGTNALLLPRGSRVRPNFGNASFSRHLIAAVLRGEPVGIFDDPATSFDIDEPGDLAALRQRGWERNIEEMERL